MIAADRYPSILRMDTTSADCLAAWLTEDVLVAVDAQYTWARFSDRNERLAQQARSMPADRFRLVNRRLVRDGQRIASAELPDLDWQPIASIVQVQLPWIGEAGQIANIKTVPWQLTRGGAECPIAGAIFQWPDLVEWVDTAPQWRLSLLRYCVCELDGLRRALVLGTPVPPIDAHFIVAKQNILIPAGWHWLPALESECVQSSFGIQPGQWLLWQASDDWCVIDDHLFVPLSRASVRSFRIEGSTAP